MPSACLYLQLHQPYRVRPDYHFFDIGTRRAYFATALNRQVLTRVARHCYLPVAQHLHTLVRQHAGAFRVALSLSGVLVEQLAQWAPATLAALQDLAAAPGVELLGETYYHSLAWCASPAEFRRQVLQHRALLRETFGVSPTTFRNTELIYDEALAGAVAPLGYRTVLAEGSPQLLAGRSPHAVYAPAAAPAQRLLLRDADRADDLGFRFRVPRAAPPLTAKEFATRLAQTTAPDAAVVNVWLDGETFGEHWPAASGIFTFLDALPAAVLAQPGWSWRTPAEVATAASAPALLTATTTTSWADAERDLSAWLGNPLQDSALHDLYALEDAVLARGDEALSATWRRLQTSDHFHYLCTKGGDCGQVHATFRPTPTPHDAYVAYTNVLNDLRRRLALPPAAISAPSSSGSAPVPSP